MASTHVDFDEVRDLFKYRDEDIEENPRLKEFAFNHAMNYRGDFVFLRRAKKFADGYGFLTTGLARGVLNCMRHDSSVRNLPVPERVKRAYALKFNKSACDMCANDIPHYPTYIDTLAGVCKGLPYDIDRKPYTTDAKIKAPFVIAKTGRLVHKSAGFGHIWWTPPQHEWGFGSSRLVAKLLCRHPSYIADPVLLMTEPDYNEPYQAARGPLSIRPCPHCREIEADMVDEELDKEAAEYFTQEGNQ